MLKVSHVSPWLFLYFASQMLKNSIAGYNLTGRDS